MYSSSTNKNRDDSHWPALDVRKTSLPLITRRAGESKAVELSNEWISFDTLSLCKYDAVAIFSFHPPFFFLCL